MKNKYLKVEVVSTDGGAVALLFLRLDQIIAIRELRPTPELCEIHTPDGRHVAKCKFDNLIERLVSNYEMPLDMTEED